MIHELKEHPEFFEDVISGRKTFEVRKADRDFKVGDLLALNEYNPDAKKYTNRCCLVYIDYILDDSNYCKDGYVILNIKPCAVIKEVLDEITEILHEAEMHGNYEPSLTIEIINDIKKKMRVDNG